MGQKHECFAQSEEYLLIEQYLRPEQVECIAPQAHSLMLEFHFAF
jgi:hypothetical protein